jgi:hypothetical protein
MFDGTAAGAVGISAQINDRVLLRGSAAFQPDTNYFAGGIGLAWRFYTGGN